MSYNFIEKTNFQKLIYDDEIYTIRHKKRFISNINISSNFFNKAFSHAYNMTFGQRGSHRNHRSGGSHCRNNEEIFTDAFQGKLAEFAVYQYFINNNIELEEPDVSVHGDNIWDDYDLKVKNYVINIKSTKFYSNLLLLETYDWDEEGHYRPNLYRSDNKYDFFILVRIKPDISKFLKGHNPDFSDESNLRNLFKEDSFKYNIVGFITNNELKQIINLNYKIERGNYLNRKASYTRLDADNYYIQSGDFHEIDELIKFLI